MRRIWWRILLCAGLAGLFASSGLATQRVNSFTARPALVFVGTPTAVTLCAELPFDPGILPYGVNAITYGPTGQPVGTPIRMYDDGTHGDVVASDLVFTVIITVYELAPKDIVMKASVAYRGTLRRVYSDPITIVVGEWPFFTAPDPAQIVTEAVEKPSNCQNGIPVSVTITPMSTALQTDGLGPYVDGTGGVIAKIYCYDFSVAVSTTGRNSRSFSVLLNNGEGGNFLDSAFNITPSWTGSPMPGKGIQVKNLLCLSDLTQGYVACEPGQNTFTTRARIMLTVPTSTDPAGYDFVYRSPSAFAATYPLTDENHTCTDSTVTVVHTPAIGSAKEYWTVTIDAAPGAGNPLAACNSKQIGTLESSILGNSGQYSVPLHLTITPQ